MKPSLPELNPQYIVNEHGQKTSVILDIQTFKKLMEEIEDMYFGTLAQVALKSDTESISLEDAKKELLGDD